MISTRERKRLTPVQIGLATSYTKNELIADHKRLEDTLERKQAELKELQDLVHAKQREIWRVRDSISDHQVAMKHSHQLTHEKREKRAYAKVRRLAAKYGLTIHNEGWHNGVHYCFDAWCESPEWIPEEDNLYHENEGCFEGWPEVLTKVQFYADYADQHGISINK
jgi:hypothetical protein